jgi:hypothetical protein
LAQKTDGFEPRTSRMLVKLITISTILLG